MKQRNEAAAELVKAVLIINGGGTVALLAFLQATWVTARVLAMPTIVAIAFLSFGAAMPMILNAVAVLIINSG